MTAIALNPGDVIDTPVGPVAVTGCDVWPSTTVPSTAVVCGIDGDGETRFLRRDGDGWTEVMPR